MDTKSVRIMFRKTEAPRWRKRKKTTPKEFKLEAVNLVTKKGYKITEAAQNLEVSESAIRQWKKQFDPNSMSSDLGSQAENKHLLMEREILKKAAAFFRVSFLAYLPKKLYKVNFIQEEKKPFPVTLLCSTTEVSRNSYYYWTIRGVYRNSQENKKVADVVKATHRTSHASYGAR